MRYIDKVKIHAHAIKLLRNSKNGMKRTANRLAACNVDKQIDAMLKLLKVSAWDLPDAVIIDGLARQLIIDFCQSEINSANNKS